MPRPGPAGPRPAALRVSRVTSRKPYSVMAMGAPKTSRAPFVAGPAYTEKSTGYLRAGSKFDGLCSMPWSSVVPSAEV